MLMQRGLFGWMTHCSRSRILGSSQRVMSRLWSITPGRRLGCSLFGKAFRWPTIFGARCWTGPCGHFVRSGGF